MTWTKLSDDFPDDCWTLSDAAVRLHLDGLIWSNRKLLDCQIPKDDLARISRAAAAVDELIACRWWTDNGEHYVIRHHAVYQRSREQVVKQQEANRVNGRRGGRAGRERIARSVTQSPSESLSESLSERDGTGRDGVGKAHLEKSEDARANDCLECQRRSVFNSGLCPNHAQAVSA